MCSGVFSGRAAFLGNKSAPPMKTASLTAAEVSVDICVLPRSPLWTAAADRNLPLQVPLPNVDRLTADRLHKQTCTADIKPFAHIARFCYRVFRSVMLNCVERCRSLFDGLTGFCLSTLRHALPHLARSSWNEDRETAVLLLQSDVDCGWWVIHDREDLEANCKNIQLDSGYDL